MPHADLQFAVHHRPNKRYANKLHAQKPCDFAGKRFPSLRMFILLLLFAPSWAGCAESTNISAPSSAPPPPGSFTQISDSFTRPDGVLGPKWSTPIVTAGEANGGPGGLLINHNGYGPVNAGGSDAESLWAGGGAFGNDQWAQAMVNTVAPYRAVLSINGASHDGDDTTYTFRVTDGSLTDVLAGGVLYVIVSDMSHPGNNGRFVTTNFGPNTFTVANASGTTATESGIGVCPSDSGAGVMVRGSGTTASTLSGYFFHVGTNSYDGGGRVAYYELWKIKDGKFTDLDNAGDTGIARELPQPRDVIALTAKGTTITAYYNNAILYQVVDTTLTSGVPGVTSWSFSGPDEYQWAKWRTLKPPGNNGTTLNNFSAGDSPFANTEFPHTH
jgi:hypothetical protein